jgi:LCP family protein required for cell wall assembly
MASRPDADPNAPLPPHLDPRGRHRGQHGSRYHAYRLVGRSLAALLSVFLLAVAGYYWLTFRNLNNGLHRLNVDFHQGQASAAPDVDGTDQNILVVGNDDRSNLSLKEARDLHVGLDGGSLATDTMMIVHIPADGSKAQILSLPRDAYVNIPGHGMNKLNAAYVDGYNSLRQGASMDARRTAGANLLIETISNLTGLTIDHFVQVSLIGFVKISDAVGGVTINLCHAVDDSAAANQAAGMDGNGSGFKMSAGVHHISGITALEFVRQRHFLPNGDLDRAARQRYFLTQAFSKITSTGTLLNPGKLNSLAKAIDQSIYVDKGLDIIKLAQQVSNLDPSHIKGKLIPFEGFDDNSPVGSVEIVNPAKVKKFVEKLFHPDQYPTTATHHHKKHHAAQQQKCIN